MRASKSVPKSERTLKIAMVRNLHYYSTYPVLIIYIYFALESAGQGY